MHSPSGAQNNAVICCGHSRGSYGVAARPPSFIACCTKAHGLGCRLRGGVFKSQQKRWVTQTAMGFSLASPHAKRGRCLRLIPIPFGKTHSASSGPAFKAGWRHEMVPGGCDWYTTGAWQRKIEAGLFAGGPG